MFYAGSEHFLIPDRDSNIFFIPDPGSYMKSGMQTSFFLLLILYFQEQSHSRSLKDPRTGIRKNFIPDPGG
jgi:hypothetical protein